MQKSRKSIGAVVMGILAAMAVAGPTVTGAVPLSPRAAAALEPCPLPVPIETYEAAGFSALDRDSDAIRAPSGRVLRARVVRPPTADTGFACPIDHNVR